MKLHHCDIICNPNFKIEASSTLSRSERNGTEFGMQAPRKKFEGGTCKEGGSWPRLLNPGHHYEVDEANGRGKICECQVKFPQALRNVLGQTGKLIYANEAHTF